MLDLYYPIVFAVKSNKFAVRWKATSPPETSSRLIRVLIAFSSAGVLTVEVISLMYVASVSAKGTRDSAKQKRSYPTI